MSERAWVRIPLQSGATSWAARVAVAVRFVPGVLITSWLVWLNTRVFQNVTSGLGSSTPGPLAVLLLLMGGAFGLVLVVSSLSIRAFVRKAAPSDILMDARGFRIVGGVPDGVTASWHDVLEIKLTTRPAEFVDGGWRFIREGLFDKKAPETQVSELLVVIAEHGGHRVAVALDAFEKRALESIANLMANAVREAREGSLPPGAISPNLAPALDTQPALAPATLACPSCQAAVAPDAADEAACPRCHASVPVPAAIRDKVKEVYALPALRAKGQAALRRMLRAPTAKTMAAVGAVLGALSLALWPAALVFVWMTARGALVTVDVLVLGRVMLATVAAILLVDALVRPLVLARYARPVMIIDYAARPPLYDGGPVRCRTCEAPLPARFDGKLARCITCSSDNVLALDLSRELPTLRRQAAALDSDIASWKRARRRAWLVALGAAVGLAGLGGLAMWRVHHDPYLADQEAACTRGDGFACTIVANTYQTRGRADLGLAVLERSCDPRSQAPGTVHACVSLAFMLSDTLFKHDPKWPARDFARAETLLRGACAHGSELACKSHRSLCERRDAPASCNAP